MSVRPSARKYQRRRHWTGSRDIWYGEFLLKSVKKERLVKFEKKFRALDVKVM